MKKLVRANNFDYAPDHKFPEIAFFCDDMVKGAIRARPDTFLELADEVIE
jgi:hypothetical protein